VLLLGFTASALMLAVVGLYGVVSNSVSGRFKEFASVWRSVPVVGAS
jgi:ABC-type antimicrobial peptide transport system permease subunit